ncbi:MAG: YdcH family protein [Candidatus Accumulibacter sp.]|nr:YdcH family protein [Accumulibacter sp.]
MLTEKEIVDTQAALDELRVEHRDLNLIVEHLAATPLPNQDQMLIQRLKKRKLAIKDRIYQIEKTLKPNAPA